MNHIEFLHYCYVNNIPLELDGNRYPIIEFKKSLVNEGHIQLEKIFQNPYYLLDDFLDEYANELLIQYRKMKIEKIKSKIYEQDRISKVMETK